MTDAAAHGSHPLAAIVIVNWNGMSVLPACLESLAGLEYANRLVIVCDNGSTDGSMDYLREHHPEVVLIDNGSNIGFAAGNNPGIRHALEAGAEYVWLLNNDTEVDPRALSELVEALEARPDAGAAGSKILYFEPDDVIWYAGGEFTQRGGVRHRGLDEPDRGQYDEPGEVTFITGCSLIGRASVFEQVGLLFEDYYLYFEEADFDWRVMRAGYKLLYVPGSVVWHKVSSSLGERWAIRQTEYIARNTLLFYRRNRPERFWPVVFWTKWAALHHLTHRRYGLGMATLKGMWLYFAGQRGPIPDRRA